MKKISFVITAMVLICATVFGVYAVSFTDVPEDAYYAEAAARMEEKGILAGYGDGQFHGNENVTRAQMAVVACRLLDKEAEAKTQAGDTVFKDVLKKHAWATGYINYAVANGIIIGDGDGNFRPDDNVKYEEVVKIIVCSLGLGEGITIDDPKDWSKGYLAAAEKANLLKSLVGKKGEAMLRSDIAVICDSSVTFLTEKEEAEVVTTTKRRVPGGYTGGGYTGGGVVTTTATTTATTAPEPVETTTVITTVGENETPLVPITPTETTTEDFGDRDMLPRG